MTTTLLGDSDKQTSMDIFEQIEAMMSDDVGTTALGREENNGLVATVSPASATAPVTLNCSVTSKSGDFTSTPEWSFEDGVFKEGKTVTHRITTQSDSVAVVAYTENGGGGVQIPIDITESQPEPVPTSLEPTAKQPPFSPRETVQFTASVDPIDGGTPTDWSWGGGPNTTLKFFDGGDATYEFDSPGSATLGVSVEMSNGNFGDASADYQVRAPNSSPTARFTMSSSEVTPPATVTFDASNSSDPDGSIRSYEWAFGDGVSNQGQTTTRRFTTGDIGTVTVELTVTDNDGATDQTRKSISVEQPPNTPPTARATATPSSGEAPVDVTFDASNSSDPDGTIRSYEWTLPGGQQATGQTVKRTYGSDDTGELTASVTVTDSDGASTTDTASVVVTKPPNTVPTATATATPTSGSPPLTVTLSGSASTDPDGTITGYSWTIPGKSSQSGETATVEFTDDDVGAYDISLTVRDNRGATATDTVTVEVVEQQLLPDVSDETLAQGAIVGVGLVSSTLFDSE